MFNYLKKDCFKSKALIGKTHQYISSLSCEVVEHFFCVQYVCFQYII